MVRKDVPQSQVLFGQAGLARDDPDFYAAYVANHILGGGGFSSRLTEEVREKRGLAYSVYSYLYPMDHGAALARRRRHGAMRAVGESIRLVRAEVARMAAGDVDARRARRRQDLPHRLVPAAPDQQRSDRRACWSSMQVDDLGIDYLERRNGYIEAVTLEDVRRVAPAPVPSGRLLIVVVGAPTGLEG